jgi:8-oxo-dGTP pyrophosphatase MutT (NUDIX family)
MSALGFSPPGGGPVDGGVIQRRAARVLLIDAADRVLLLHGVDPARPEHGYWFTVGGGLDGGETPAQAAARELAEETGLTVDPARLGEPIWRNVTDFPFDGRWYHQEQDFFAYRVQSLRPDTGGFNHIEHATIDAYRWWSVAELAETGDRFYPEELVELLRGILEG